MTVADFPDWQAPQAHADQIAVTGVPLLTKSTLLANTVYTNLAAGASNGTVGLPVTQTGYEIILNPKFAAGTTNPFIEVQLQWVDSGTGLQVASDSFYLPGSEAPSGLAVFGRGPTKGNQLFVTVTNLSSNNPVTTALTVLQNSRVYASDVWRFQNSSVNNQTVAGFTLPTFPDDESCLGTVTGASVAASGSASWLMGIGSGGPVTVTLECSGPVATNARFHAYALPSSVYGTTAPLIAYQAANLNQAYTFNPPRAPWLLQAVNTATSGAMTVNFAAFAST